MDEFDVLFSKEMFAKMEEAALMHIIAATVTDDEKVKQIKLFVRAFTKRGVPAKTVLDALIEISKKGGAE